MKTADWYFDVVSPFAYLQSRLLDRFAGKLDIVYRPVLFAGLLNAWGTMGPAELTTKRIWTYRLCQWFADKHGIPFKMPPGHPFNPLRALRLAIALDNDPAAIHAIFGFIWEEGRDINEPADWQALTERFGVTDADERLAAPAVKAALRDGTEAAVARGIFGVPTLVIDDNLFWGVDGTDMALDYLADPTLFEAGEMARFETLPTAAART